MAKFLFTEQFAFSKGDSVVVIGLGRFGSSVGQSLMRLGHDVMGIDRDAEREADHDAPRTRLLAEDDREHGREDGLQHGACRVLQP